MRDKNDADPDISPRLTCSAAAASPPRLSSTEYAGECRAAEYGTQVSRPSSQKPCTYCLQVQFNQCCHRRLCAVGSRKRRCKFAALRGCRKPTPEPPVEQTMLMTGGLPAPCASRLWRRLLLTAAPLWSRPQMRMQLNRGTGLNPESC